MSNFGPFKQLIGLASLLTVAGCASPRILIDEFAISDSDLRCDAEVMSRAIRSVTPTADSGQTPEIRFLLLSGGGSRGAWGAGFLKGLNERGEALAEPRVVTGVSTGSLQATYAFLGDFDELFQFYTSVENADIYKKRFPLLVPFSNSVRTVGPLREILEREIDIEVLRRVAGQPDRLLCVGTVIAESGEFFAWNLSGIARKAVSADAAGNNAESRHWQSVYREAIIASAAVPVMFPPVTVEREQTTETHLDGGVRSNVFYSPLWEMLIEAVRRRTVDRGSAPVLVDIVVNGQPGATVVESPTGIVKIGTRSLELALAQVHFTSAVIAQYEALKDQASADAVEFRYSYIPDDQCVDFDSLEFSIPRMRALAEAGRARAASEEPWFEDIAFEVLDGVCD